MAVQKTKQPPNKNYHNLGQNSLNGQQVALQLEAQLIYAQNREREGVSTFSSATD